jgi:uncharacterized damage-inducible protein DinB
MKQLLEEYTQYNVWANETILSFVQQLSPEQLDLPQLSSFDSIRKTLDHLADCEYNWLKRINGDSSPEYKSASFGNDLKALYGFLIGQSKGFVEVVQHSDEESLQKLLAYKNLKGVSYENKLYKIIMHVMNHSTYHRGQLVTMMRGAGITLLGSTDLIGFYRLVDTGI